VRDEWGDSEEVDGVGKPTDFHRTMVQKGNGP